MPSGPLAERVRALAEAAAAQHLSDARAAAQEALSANLRAVARFRVEVRGDSCAAAELYPPSWAADEPGATIADWSVCRGDRRPGEDARVRLGGAARSDSREAARAALASVALTIRMSWADRVCKSKASVHQMTLAPAIPRSDAWVPVRKEFWIPKEFDFPSYIPWLGDDEDELRIAGDVSDKWRESEGGDEDSVYSDGELDGDGNFSKPDKDEANDYDSLGEQTRRAAARTAIAAVYAEHDRQDPAVAEATAAALNLRSQRHVLKMLELAETRAAEAEKAEAKRAVTRRETARSAAVWRGGGVVHDELDEEVDAATVPLIHFCFTCHSFLCPRHKGHNVEPIVPIKDFLVERRMGALRKIGRVSLDNNEDAMRANGISPCRSQCYLTSLATADDPAAIAASWTKEELLVFRESVPVFKRDACSIAKMIGPTKSCEETHRYMELPGISAEITRTIMKDGRKRWPLKLNRGGQSTQADEASDEDSVEDTGKNSGGGSSGGGGGGIGRIGRKRVRRKAGAQCRASHSVGENTRDLQSRFPVHGGDGGGSGVSDGDDRSATVGAGGNGGVDSGKGSISEDCEKHEFKPCAHLGLCNKAACSCFKKGISCEATCGCNTGRWTLTGYDTPGAKGISVENTCKNRHWGCLCSPGDRCDTDKCQCVVDHRSCNPDFCHCDAKILPSQIELDSRNCRNVAMLTGRHKLTFIGQSPVHGLGLFAGEVFEAGDLIGPYGGGMMEWTRAERIGHLYDAKNHTFQFELTKSLVVDAGMLGSKTKYINHTNDTLKENAEARCILVRGVGRLGLFASRRVEVGEEFLYNYDLQVAVPEWAKTGGSTLLSADTPHRE